MCTTSSSSSPSADLKAEKGRSLLRWTGVKGGAVPRTEMINVSQASYTSEQTPCTEPGRSKAGVSEILMASFMAASKPFPPSPRRAGPKHSGRRMSSLTTTLEFSSTLSPGESSVEGEATAQPTEEETEEGREEKRRTRKRRRRTIDEDGKPQERKVALPFDGVPANVWIPFSQEHWTALEPTACQICNHLRVQHRQESQVLS